MPYDGKYGDAAPVQNRLTELKNDLSGRINVVAEEVSDVKRLLKVDLALRMGALTPAEAKRLLLRRDPGVVNQVLNELIKDRGNELSLE